MKRTSPDRLYDAYIFDMDGTIYLGDDLLPGAKRLIEGLRELGRPVRFLSNNPTKDPQLYLEKLGKLGIPTPIEEIANTVVTTVRWLKANHPDAAINRSRRSFSSVCRASRTSCWESFDGVMPNPFSSACNSAHTWVSAVPSAVLSGMSWYWYGSLVVSPGSASGFVRPFAARRTER